MSVAKCNANATDCQLVASDAAGAAEDFTRARRVAVEARDN
jgi:hypothetical protein